MAAVDAHGMRRGNEASAGSLFSRTLQDITATKLKGLAKKRDRFERQREALRAKTASIADPLENLEAWSAGVKACFDLSLVDGRVARGGSDQGRLEMDVQNLDRFIAQARHDPSISPAIRAQWQAAFQRHVDVQSLRYTFAALYGELTTEWLSFRRSGSPANAGDAADSTKMEVDEDFEHIEDGKRLETRERWAEAVFSPAEVDGDAIQEMLQQAFEPAGEENKALRDSTQAIRRHVKSLEKQLAAATNFTHETLGWTIRSLLSSDLLTDEKREVLRDFESNNTILTEIADVLNMWMSSIESWTWGEEVGLEVRRRMDGGFTIYMHEDLLQAIFLHFIGIKWAVAFKSAFRTHGQALETWKSPHAPLSKQDHGRRLQFLGSVTTEKSVAAKRAKLYGSRYFLAQLPDSETQQFSRDEGEEEANYDQMVPQQLGPQPMSVPAVQAPMMQMQMQQQQQASVLNQHKQQDYQMQLMQLEQQNRKRMALAHDGQRPSRRRKSYNGWPFEDDDNSDDMNDDLNSSQTKVRNPMEAKQRLLHLLSTEILIRTRLHGEITCFRSQFGSWFSSLPHEAILRTLSFFGVSKRWITFFRSFLQPRLRFLDEEESEARIRQKGVPSAHRLSEMFGEVVLFALDFQVNRDTGGQTLWRMHDDFWFWANEPSICQIAWNTVNTFASTMGLSLNATRSGSVRIQRVETGSKTSKKFKAVKTTGLPHGDIRWGMLLLNPESGRFEIDEAMVTKHIDELCKQLKDKSGSVFAWIQAWNTYAATFFTSNFGKPANCFGREHVDQMLATHEHIQRAIFSSLTSTQGNATPSGSVVEFLKQILEQRFGICDIPDGYFYFPVELGGLELQSPFIHLLQIHDMVQKDPDHRLDEFLKAEKAAYAKAKTRWERNEMSAVNQESVPNKRRGKAKREESVEEFMSFEEYSEYREQLSYPFQNSLRQVFDDLLCQPTESPVQIDPTGVTMNAVTALGRQQNSSMCGIHSNWHQMTPYWKWVTQLYGPEIIERFGGLAIVDPGLLPIGMVGLFRSGRVKWQD